MEENKNVIDFRNRKINSDNTEIYESKIKHLTTDYGTIMTDKRHTTYTNEYFGFIVKVPGEWATFGYNEMMALAVENMKRLVIDESKKKQMLEQMAQNLNLFRACPSPTRLPNAEDNPTFTCTASKVIMQPNTKAKEFIQGVKEEILKGEHGIKYSIIQDIKPTIIGGVRFDMMEVCGEYPGVKLYSRYFSTIRKGYELIFIASCMTDKGLEMLDKIIKSIEFKI